MYLTCERSNSRDREGEGESEEEKERGKARAGRSVLLPCACPEKFIVIHI